MILANRLQLSIYVGSGGFQNCSFHLLKMEKKNDQQITRVTIRCFTSYRRFVRVARKRNGMACMYAAFRRSCLRSLFYMIAAMDCLNYAVQSASSGLNSNGTPRPTLR